MFNKDLAYNDCNYRFKGKSCEDCKLDCIYKNKNDLYGKYKAQGQQLNKLATKLEKIIKICEEAIRLCSCPEPDVNFDCIDCTEGGRASLAKEIMEVLKDENE